MAIPISGADAWLTLNGKLLSFQGDDENLDAQTYETRDNMLRVTLAAPEDLQVYVDEKLLETERYGRWLWRPDGYAGLYLLQVIAPGTQYKQQGYGYCPKNFLTIDTKRC